MADKVLRREAGPRAGGWGRWLLLVALAAALVAWLTVRAPRRSAPPSDAGQVRGTPLVSPPPPAATSEATAGEDLAAGLGGSQDTQDALLPPNPPVAAALNARKPLDPASASTAVPTVLARPGYQPVSFLKLGEYDYRLFDSVDDGGPAELPDQIPAEIRALNGRKVTVSGYMIPIELDETKVRSFLLVKNQLLCCFGVPPRMNEWIYVEMDKDRRCDYVADVPAHVSGELIVGEEMQDGIVMSIYRMRAEHVVHGGGY